MLRLRILIIFVLAFFMIGLGSCKNYILIDDECHPEMVPASDYYDNVYEGMKEYSKVLIHFKPNDDKYTDDFGGVYVDEHGIYNICVVGDRKPLESKYIRYLEVKYSRNYLYNIYNELSGVMNDYTIWEVSVCDYCNKINISLEDKSKINLVIDYLKTKDIYQDDILNFFVGKNSIQLN